MICFFFLCIDRIWKLIHGYRSWTGCEFLKQKKKNKKETGRQEGSASFLQRGKCTKKNLNPKTTSSLRNAQKYQLPPTDTVVYLGESERGRNRRIKMSDTRPVPRRESPWGLSEGQHRQPKAHRCNDRAEDVIQVIILNRTLPFGFGQQIRQKEKLYFLLGVVKSFTLCSLVFVLINCIMHFRDVFDHWCVFLHVWLSYFPRVSWYWCAMGLN